MVDAPVVLLLEHMYLEEGSRLPRPLVDKDLCALIERHIVNDLSEHCRREVRKLTMGADWEQEFMTLGALLAYQGKFRAIMDEGATAGTLDEAWWCERFIGGLRPISLREYVQEKLKSKLELQLATLQEAFKLASSEVQIFQAAKKSIEPHAMVTIRGGFQRGPGGASFQPSKGKGKSDRGSEADIKAQAQEESTERSIASKEDTQASWTLSGGGDPKPRACCFNCMKVGHGVPRCPEPRDEARIRRNQQDYDKLLEEWKARNP